MTTVYTLRERDDQLLLEKISWRPLAYMNPEREAKRKEDQQTLLLSMVDVWPGGQIKWCSAYPRFDTEQASPAEERAATFI